MAATGEEKAAPLITGADLEVLLADLDTPLVIDAYATWCVFVCVDFFRVVYNVSTIFYLVLISQLSIAQCSNIYSLQVWSMFINGSGIRRSGTRIEGEGTICQVGYGPR
jgi:hypothetical protein